MGEIFKKNVYENTEKIINTLKEDKVKVLGFDDPSLKYEEKLDDNVKGGTWEGIDTPDSEDMETAKKINRSKKKNEFIKLWRENKGDPFFENEHTNEIETLNEIDILKKEIEKLNAELLPILQKIKFLTEKEEQIPLFINKEKYRIIDAIKPNEEKLEQLERLFDSTDSN